MLQTTWIATPTGLQTILNENFLGMLTHMLEARGEDNSQRAIFEPMLPSRCVDRTRKSTFKIV